MTAILTVLRLGAESIDLQHPALLGILGRPSIVGGEAPLLAVLIGVIDNDHKSRLSILGATVLQQTI